MYGPTWGRRKCIRQTALQVLGHNGRVRMCGNLPLWLRRFPRPRYQCRHGGSERPAGLHKVLIQTSATVATWSTTILAALMSGHVQVLMEPWRHAAGRSTKSSLATAPLRRCTKVHPGVSWISAHVAGAQRSHLCMHESSKPPVRSCSSAPHDDTHVVSTVPMLALQSAPTTRTRPAAAR